MIIRVRRTSHHYALFVVFLVGAASVVSLALANEESKQASEEVGLASENTDKTSLGSDKSQDSGHPSSHQSDPAIDDPNAAWEEWGETEHSRRIPRRQREIKPGMDIRSVMGMVMKQQKTFSSFVVPASIPSQLDRDKLISRFRSKLVAGGVQCRMWFLPDSRQLVITTESVLDAHNAKDFLLKQPDIERVVLDNVQFTPPANDMDDDLDSDEL